MYRHSLKTHKTFNSQTEKKVIIGGETDFCAERFGYIQRKNGITPAPAAVQTEKQIAAKDIITTLPMPTGTKVIFCMASGLAHSWNFETGVATTETALTKTYPSIHSVVVDGEYYCAVVSGNKIAMFSSEKKATTMTIPVQLANSVMHCGRLFGVDATDGYLLRWSGYSLNDWTEGVDKAGYVRLNPSLGKLLNLFVLNEKIVIVREAGITTITTLGDSRHMRADICDKHALPDVYVNSSVICGGKLWIYTQKGMYVYDGSNLSQAPFDRIMSDYVLSHARVIWDRYICYTAAKGDNRCLFVYDTQTGIGNPFCKNCHSAFFGENRGLAFKDRYLCNLVEDTEDPDRVWVSVPFAYEKDKPAVLKSLTVEGSGDFTVEADCDGRKIYAVGSGKYRFSESAQSFTFKVTGEGSVTSMTAEWEVRK